MSNINITQNPSTFPAKIFQNTSYNTLSQNKTSLPQNKHSKRNLKSFRWPKITHPKLPFSYRKVEDKEERQKRIMAMKPSPLFHDFYTVQWLRHKYNDKVVEKSICTLLPDNGKPVVPDDESEGDRKHRLLMEWLEEYCKPNEKYKHININPKYFFSETTFEKILKLKEIFLEFDEDGSRKMEIDEMVEMFNQNHIQATMSELVSLFFKDVKVKEEDVDKLYLDFYQFMNFTLTKDQDFRLFMRKIKEKYKKNNIDEEQNGYLPMNFNLVLDYFITKGKERTSIDIIDSAIKEMDKIINKRNTKRRDTYLEMNSLPATERNGERQYSRKEDEIKEYDQQLKKINFNTLIDEFSKLFSLNGLVLNSNKENKKVKVMTKSTLRSLNSPELTKSDTNKSKEMTDDNNYLSEFVQNEMKKKNIMQMNVDNLEKFHDLKLALNATREQLKSNPEFKKIFEEEKMCKTTRNTKNSYSKSLRKNNNVLPSIKSRTTKLWCESNRNYNINYNGFGTGDRTKNKIASCKTSAKRKAMDYVPNELLY